MANSTLQQVSRRATTGKKGQAPKEPGKGQLWDGIVSIILVEGKKMIPMDDSGRCVRGVIAPLLGFGAHQPLYVRQIGIKKEMLVHTFGLRINLRST